jgi:phosphoglycerol transferase
MTTRNYPIRRWLLIGLMFVHCLLLITYFISDSFTGTGFDESVVYFLHTGTDGFETDGFRYLMISTALLVVLCLYLSVKVGKSRLLASPKNNGRALGINIGLVALLLLQPVFNVLATQPLYNIVTNQVPPSIDLEIPDDIFIPRKKNIVYLYLESFERTFLDDRLFPGLAPNLRELEKQGLAFTNIGDIYGTRWTIAGMVASQCGLPLEPMPNVNEPGSFMPKAICLGDVLKQNGYETSYLGGASLRFGGKGTFYRTHQFDTVAGLEEHLERFPLGSLAYSHWGLYDEDLFKLAREELARLATIDKPFAFFLLTLDTHPPSGFPSAVCEGIKYAKSENPMLNSFHCSDRLAGNFIREMMASELADDTLFVIASDHLALKNDAHEALQPIAERRNLFFILDKNGTPGSIAKFGSPLDIAPSLLAYLGSDIDHYNLGSNLLGDKRTIMEAMEDPNRALRLWSSRLGEFYD